MKRLLIVSFLFLACFSIYAADDVSHDDELNPQGWWADFWDGAFVSYDLYGRSVLLGMSDLNFGGGLSIGVETENFIFQAYGQGDYFLFPLASTGTAAALEFDLEAGITLGWKFIKFWHFDVFIACDIGYFAQFVKTHYQPEGYTLGFNGIMLRPKLMTELNIGRYYGISVGVFYQFPLYPSYSRYQGIGLMVSIL